MAEKEHKEGHEHEGGSHGGGGHGAHGGGGGHAEGEHEGAPEWLISFADNVALMMGFFVILLAMNMKDPTAGGIGGKDKNGGAPDSKSVDFVIAIRDAFSKTMRDRCPKGASIEVVCHSHTPAVLVPMHSPAMELAAEAVEIGFGTRPTLIRGGGSIPVVGLIKSILGIDTLLVGFGLPDDRVHSPDEKFDLDALHYGARTAAALYERLARLEGIH